MSRLAIADRSAVDEWSRPGFWRTFLIVLGAILALVGMLNVLVDPLDLYGSGWLPPWQFNRYERKLELFSHLNPPAQALILGSSRVESIDPDLVSRLTGKRCFNWGLPSASAEIMLAVLRLAVEEHSAPIELVIVGVDPVAFHPSRWVHPQARLVPAYTRYFERAPRMAGIREKVSRLLTMEQTTTSYLVLRREAGLDEPQERVGYREDGRAVYFQRESAIAAGTFDLQQILGSRIPSYPEESLGLSTFSEMSQSRQRMWEQFLAMCNEKGIRVYVFMPPVHPDLWKLLVEKGAGPIFEEVSAFLDRTVTEAGGVFRDYTQLASFGGDPELFYDEVHMRPGNVEVVLKRLLAEDEAETREGVQ